MSGHSHMFSSWPFADSINTAAFCTDKVAHLQFPVLQVAHDHNGDWQFLDATADTPGECVLLCMGCVYERDASLAGISDLPRGWSAYRTHVGAEWERWEEPCETDGDEEKVHADIAAYGLHIINVMEEDDEPPFSYSLGIEKSLGMPDLIVVGLKHELAQSVINECYRQMQAGLQLEPGTRVSGLLGGGFDCVIGDVSAPNYQRYMGWAVWLYQDAQARACQIVFPSTAGVFPWEAQANAGFKQWQPLLAEATPGCK